MSQFLLQVLSRSFALLPPFLDFLSFFLTLVERYFLLYQGLLLMPVFSNDVHSFVESIFSPRTRFVDFIYFHRQGIIRFLQIGIVFLTFKKIVSLNRKHKIFCTPSLSFEQWAKNCHASQIGCRVAPFRNHWACLTTAECPCLGLYAREMPGFLSPLLLLLLPFTYSSAAPNHFAKRLIGMQWEESPPPSCPPDQLGLCICPQL